MSFGSIPDNCKRFVLRNFGKVDHISREHTIQRIENMLVSNETEYENDLPKLILILAIITFFFPDNQRELAWGYLQYIIDEKKINQVSWPLCIHQSLVRNLKAFKSKPRNMPGCSMLPLVRKQYKLIIF